MRTNTSWYNTFTSYTIRDYNNYFVFSYVKKQPQVGYKYTVINYRPLILQGCGYTWLRTYNTQTHIHTHTLWHIHTHCVCFIQRCQRDYCDAAVIMSIADVMEANGMRDLGYTYINLDGKLFNYMNLWKSLTLPLDRLLGWQKGWEW